MNRILRVLSALAAAVTALSSNGDTAQIALGSDESAATSFAGPVMNHNFPDPTIVKHNGVWYAFATNNPPSAQPHVQLATSTDFQTWTLASRDPLLDTGAWSVGNSTWAPSVIQRPDGSWILYYTNPITSDPAKHCIGVATAAHVAGPYTPVGDTPYICPLAQGGAIDPAAFRDTDGRYWLTYKVDGNSLGHGGACMNGAPPIAPTPIMLQRLGRDLITKVGAPTQLITNDAPEDGPDVEAPSLVRAADGAYFLFYSSNCFTSPEYDIAYATATRIAGPYTRRGALLKTGDRGLSAPGGATVDLDGAHIVFHANCPEGRCMYTGTVKLKGTTATI